MNSGQVRIATTSPGPSDSDPGSSQCGTTSRT